jgi:hypothetical protein
MHPMLHIAVARGVERDRQRARHEVELRSLAIASRARGFDGSRAGGSFARLFAGISVRPRLS